MRIRYFLINLLICSSLQAQTQVSGNITNDTTWDSTGNPYQVVDNVTVTSGYFLTILAGVEVQFMGDYRITVNGGMTAWGTETDSVKFVNYSPTGWKYIEYIEALGDQTLNYCLIESGERAVYVTDSQVTLNHCLIQGHESTPIRSERQFYNTEITVSHCTITGNGGSGIYASNSTAYLENCWITYNSVNAGVTAQENATVNINGGYIAHNTGPGIYGLTANTITLNEVEIAENGQYGVWLTSCIELEASRVLIHNNGIHGILLANTPMDARNLTVSSNGENGIHFSSIYNHILELSSSIVDTNEAYGIYFQDGMDFLSYNDVYRNVGDNYYNCYPGNGAISADPLYVNLASMDFHIQENSPCKDTGSPLDPLDPDGTVTDMGRYYYDQSGTPVKSSTKPDVITDFKIIAVYPNPFNPVLNLRIQAARPEFGSVQAWTAHGRLIARIWEGQFNTGINDYTWRAEACASGVYYIRLTSGEATDIIPCVLIK